MRPDGRRPQAAPGGAGAPLIELGRIVKRHGVRGEVRMRPHNPTSSILTQLAAVVLRGPDGAGQTARVRGARRHQQFVLLRFEGVDTADQAQALIGRAVCVRRDQLPPLAPHEAYHAELVGCVVRTERGEDIGTVQRVLSTGSNDVCVVAGEGREHLIPLIADVIARLDVAAGEIVVRPLPGLLDP